jgi:hypothetical protein
MFPADTLHLLQGGRTASFFEGFDEAGLNSHLRTLKTCRGQIDAVEANVLVAIKHLHEVDSPSAKHSDAADNLTEGTGESRSEARKKTRRAKLIDLHPAVAEALLSGRISSGHADALSTIPAKFSKALETDLAELLGWAAEQSVDQFNDTIRRWKERQSSQQGENYHKSRRDQRTLSFNRDRQSGMTRISGLLDPENAAITRSLLSETEQELLRSDQAETADNADQPRRTAAQRMADALTRICQLARRGKTEGGPKPEPTVIVTIPLSDLISGLGDAEAFGGGSVSAQAARRLACEGGIIPAVLGGAGQVLDLGRRTRLASAGQRLSLRAQYGGCALPGCDAPFEWCHMHHIDHWEHGGSSDLGNLIPVCTRHHAQIHDGRLEIARDEFSADIWSRPATADAERPSRAEEHRRSHAAARPPRCNRTPDDHASAQPGQQQTLAV